MKSLSASEVRRRSQRNNGSHQSWIGPNTLVPRRPGSPKLEGTGPTGPTEWIASMLLLRRCGVELGPSWAADTSPCPSVCIRLNCRRISVIENQRSMNDTGSHWTTDIGTVTLKPARWRTEWYRRLHRCSVSHSAGTVHCVSKKKRQWCSTL